MFFPAAVQTHCPELARQAGLEPTHFPEVYWQMGRYFFRAASAIYLCFAIYATAAITTKDGNKMKHFLSTILF